MATENRKFVSGRKFFTFLDVGKIMTQTQNLEELKFRYHFSNIIETDQNFLLSNFWVNILLFPNFSIFLLRLVQYTLYTLKTVVLDKISCDLQQNSLLFLFCSSSGWQSAFQGIFYYCVDKFHGQ